MGYLRFTGEIRIKMDKLNTDPKRAMDRCIEHLRRKLTTDMADLKVIEKIRGSGAEILKIDFAFEPASGKETIQVALPAAT